MTAAPPQPKGPGTILEDLIAHVWFGKCQGCAALARKMDARGAAWCRENAEHIADHMLRTARAGWVPGGRRAALRVLHYAIDRAVAEGFG